MTEAKTAIVTGAAKRVGAHIAAALLERGLTVVAHVHHHEDQVPSGTIRAVADLGDEDCAQAIFAACEGLPPVHLLVNNAARFSWDGIADFDVGEFSDHMNVNVRAPILLTREFARRHRGGDALVVNLLDSKLRSLNPDFLSYTLSKQALAGFTELAARALADRSIRVNGIAPSLMLRSNGQSEENYRQMHQNNPLKHGVTPDDVVIALDYMLASPSVTGEILLLDSGQRFSPPARDVQFLG